MVAGQDVTYMPCPEAEATVSKADYEAVLDTADRLRRYIRDIEYRLKVGSDELTVELNEHNGEFKRNCQIATHIRRIAAQQRALLAVDESNYTLDVLDDLAGTIESGEPLS